MGEKLGIEIDPLLSDNERKITGDGYVLNVYRMAYCYTQKLNSLTTKLYVDKKCNRLILSCLRKKYGTVDRATGVLLQYLEDYRGNYSSKTKEKWRIKNILKDGKISLEYARVISIALTDGCEESIDVFNQFLLSSRYFIINKKRIMIPLTLDDLNNELAYLAGVIAGDGHIENDTSEIKIVDGHSNKKMKRYSLEFLNRIARIVRKNFNCNGYFEKIDNGNYFVLRYSSSLFSRAMNYLYDIPTGDKSSTVMCPKMIKNTNKECLFWRGVFDTDGSIREKNKAIRLSTISEPLFLDFLDFCKRNCLTTFDKRYLRRFDATIAEESMANFANIIGASHPRKQKNLIEYLKKGATYAVPINRKYEPELERVAAYLRPYRENVYIRLTDRREKVTKGEIENRLGLIRKTLKCRIIRIRRPRKNDHYYICSKELSHKLKEHYRYEPTWRHLQDDEIERLKQRWDSYG